MSATIQPAHPVLSVTDAKALESLNQRFAVIRDRVRGVAGGFQTGLYLFGRPGTGKTHLIKKTLESDHVSFHYESGHLTAIGLFELLAEHPDQLIVLDDISAIFKQQVALQFLLAALGNQSNGTGERIIRYRRQGKDQLVHFTGGLIMTSNLQLHADPILGALKSRVNYLNFDPTDAQVAALMRDIASRGWPVDDPGMTPGECTEVAEFLITESKKLGLRFDLRLLVDKAFPDFLQHAEGETETDWRNLVLATLEERLIDLKHSLPPGPSRQERKAQEQELVRQLLIEYPAPADQIAEWVARTGKVERAFYRRKKDIEMMG